MPDFPDFRGRRLSVMEKMKKCLAVLLALCGLIGVSGCSSDVAPDKKPVTPSDLVSDVSSREEATRISVEEAVSIRLDGEDDSEVFLLSCSWYGEEFRSEDSLNKMMMMKYITEGSHAPYAANHCVVTIEPDASEGDLMFMRLTQIANTVRVDSGLPYTAEEIDLALGEDGTRSFEVSFRDYQMYYYELDCQWKNGNAARYVFALEKNGNK